jgi:F-type H+-transporting ATPase subunit alpha
MTAQNKNFRRTTKQTKAVTSNQTIKTFLKTSIKQNNISYKTKIPSTGSVYKIFDGVAQVEFLKSRIGEIVILGSKTRGIVLGLEKKFTSVAVLGNERVVSAGDSVRGTGNLLNIAFSPKLLGHVVDSLGRQIDHNVISTTKMTKLKIEQKAPGICTRMSVHEPLHTGIKVIDTMVPIGRGQRELIIGDRSTGKTAVALTTIINQRFEAEDLFSVYVATGQRRSTVAQVVKTLKRFNVYHKSVIVAATASESPALQYLAPYTGCSIGERFRDSGYHSLLIYDDLTKQAIAYRQMSLLLRKPPGREAYPGDVFYLHSRLLERAAKLNHMYGAGSLTALPVIETQASDVSAYIPTNVISITDGQIFLQAELFISDIKPAVDLSISVSRVGNAAQLKPLHSVSKGLKIKLAEFRAMAYFLSFNASFDAATMRLLERGARLVEILKQGNLRAISPDLQIVLIFAGMQGYFDLIPVDEVKKFKAYTLFNLSFLQTLLKFESNDLTYVLNEKLLHMIMELTQKAYLSFTAK